MFRKVLFLAVIIAICSFNCYAEVIDSSWVGGKEGTWENASNWDPAIVPDNNATNTFNVTIAAVITDGNDIGIGLTQSHTINRMDCNVTGDGGILHFSKWTSDWIELRLDEPNGLTNYGLLEIDEINIEGNLNNAAGACCDLEDMDIEGNLYNQANAKMEFEGEFDIGDDGNLENAGTMWMWGPGVSLWIEGTLHNVGQINLYAADCGANRILNDSNGVIQGWGNLCTEDEGELLQNEGAIYASGGSLVIATENNAISNNGILGCEPGCFLHVKPACIEPGQEDVSNLDKIKVKGGGCVTFCCNLFNQANGEIELLGGTLAATTITQSADANFAGFGGITGDVVIEPNGIIKLTGPTNIVGDVNIPANATLQISDGQTLITGHTTCKGTIRLIGGTVIFQGGCDCNDCNIINEAGECSNLFDVNKDGTVDFRDFAGFAENWLWDADWYAP
jgi:hypothetical protein